MLALEQATMADFERALRFLEVLSAIVDDPDALKQRIDEWKKVLAELDAANEKSQQLAEATREDARSASQDRAFNAAEKARLTEAIDRHRERMTAETEALNGAKAEHERQVAEFNRYHELTAALLSEREQDVFARENVAAKSLASLEADRSQLDMNRVELDKQITAIKKAAGLDA